MMVMEEGYMRGSSTVARLGASSSFVTKSILTSVKVCKAYYITTAPCVLARKQTVAVPARSAV